MSDTDDTMTLAPPVQLTDAEAWKLRALQSAAQLARRDADLAVATAKAHWQTLAVRHGFDADAGWSLTDDGRLIPATSAGAPG